jgi:hypothetical protein
MACTPSDATQIGGRGASSNLRRERDAIQAVGSVGSPGKRGGAFRLLLVVRQDVRRARLGVRPDLLCAGTGVLPAAVLSAGRRSGGAGSQLESGSFLQSANELLSVSPLVCDQAAMILIVPVAHFFLASGQGPPADNQGEDCGRDRARQPHP